ncbi:MAG: phosphoglycerate kinase [Proteobacteria bacterium]|nr:phosphoglycerate kinase [Pseudomonadota bacterium]
MKMLTMDSVLLQDKWVLIREDFNVPMNQGKITHTARIDAALPTLKKALALGAKVIVMSHLGRPTEGTFDPLLSLKPIAKYLETCLKQQVPVFALGENKPALKQGELALLENVRFLPGEEQNDTTLATQLAALCDVFVMDAFAVAHRSQASTCGVAKYAPIACAGPLLQSELQAIRKVLVAPQRPVVAIVGGSKVSSKLKLLNNLLSKVDTLVVGGGIANTFLAAMDLPIGESLYEASLVSTAKSLLEKAKSLGKTIWLPKDVVVAKTLSEDASTTIKPCEAVNGQDKIFDIGPESLASLKTCLSQAKTILWNGPVGVFECKPFAKGTQSLALMISESNAFTVAGGGDTLAAAEQFYVSNNISYLSTGGGAFLEALEGKILPAVAALESKAKEKVL